MIPSHENSARPCWGGRRGEEKGGRKEWGAGEDRSTGIEKGGRRRKRFEREEEEFWDIETGFGENSNLVSLFEYQLYPK